MAVKNSELRELKAETQTRSSIQNQQKMQKGEVE